MMKSKKITQYFFLFFIVLTSFSVVKAANGPSEQTGFGKRLTEQLQKIRKIKSRKRQQPEWVFVLGEDKQIEDIEIALGRYTNYVEEVSEGMGLSEESYYLREVLPSIEKKAAEVIMRLAELSDFLADNADLDDSRKKKVQQKVYSWRQTLDSLEEKLGKKEKLKRILDSFNEQTEGINRLLVSIDNLVKGPLSEVQVKRVQVAPFSGIKRIPRYSAQEKRVLPERNIVIREVDNAIGVVKYMLNAYTTNIDIFLKEEPSVFALAQDTFRQKLAQSSDDIHKKMVEAAIITDKLPGDDEIARVFRSSRADLLNTCRDFIQLTKFREQKAKGSVKKAYLRIAIEQSEKLLLVFKKPMVSLLKEKASLGFTRIPEGREVEMIALNQYIIDLGGNIEAYGSLYQQKKAPSVKVTILKKADELNRALDEGRVDYDVPPEKVDLGNKLRAITKIRAFSDLFRPIAEKIDFLKDQKQRGLKAFEEEKLKKKPRAEISSFKISEEKELPQESAKRETEEKIFKGEPKRLLEEIKPLVSVYVKKKQEMKTKRGEEKEESEKRAIVVAGQIRELISRAEGHLSEWVESINNEDFFTMSMFINEILRELR